MSGVVPIEWISACIVPLYEGQSHRYKCSNSKGKNLMSVDGNLRGRVLINRNISIVDGVIDEEQCGSG